MTTSGNWQPPDLSGRVALVTGASRGVGLGVALALGDCGATVYVTGRSTRDGGSTEGVPGTVEEAAEQVSLRGGKGIAVRCDHTDDADNAALVETIAAEGGRLDLLVNNAWAGYERFSEEAPFHAPFWKQPMWRYDLFAGSLRGQFAVSRLAAPLLMQAPAGLIVNVSFTDGDVYLGQTPYDICKYASDRMVVGMTYDLRKTPVVAVALHPGFVRTERVAGAWDLVGEGPARIAHSPEYVGRAVAALGADPDLASYAGARLSVGDLAAKYGFDDVDGRRPPPFRLEGTITLAARMERLGRIARTGPAPARGGGK
ncbi:SDR family NAD(P)-dependent oxidoreductase [Nocardia sp. BMG51109]|uniref:SDR family NAD(P)-dependent oxidoreductase n=1 Tax=Nocardia sp. BMG51109 TaxID=1056816 RepID=UPI0004658F33|nr:SDR family NAD(P)-dependent oxidoreductase [Nocardia sp. BMG51109]